MKRHGGSAPITFRERNGHSPTPAVAADRRRFRNFLRPPTAAERFKVYGRDPAADESAARGLLRRLARCLPDDLDWPVQRGTGALPWENPNVPAGYTYLAQLVGHDLVQTSMHAPSLEKPGEAFRNLRSFGLDLDTLYGGGPSACPHAYAVTDFDDSYRTKLRLGRIRPSSDAVPAAEPPYRDIGRARVCGGNDIQRRGRTDALLADPRNDDNSNLSQLTTVFIHLHNAVVDKIAADELAPQRPGHSGVEALETQFAVARQVVRTVYRRIIRQDLLPRLLHPRVHAIYDAATPRFIDTGAGEQIPLEFSHAGYRFGHAMVRPHYQINSATPDAQSIDDVLLTTSARMPWNTPLNEQWIVQWSYFFEVGRAPRPNLSRRIGPSLAGKLEPTRRPQAPADDEPFSLAHRDLLRGASAGMWSVRALIAEIRQRRPELIELSDLLINFGSTRARVESWLRLYGSRILEPDDFAALAEDPPLFFFLLFEAAYGDMRGCRLGVLGSIIVAETLYQALAAHPGDQLPDAALQQVQDRVFDGRPIETMPQLLEFVADAAGLRHSMPPFL